MTGHDKGDLLAGAGQAAGTFVHGAGQFILVLIGVAIGLVVLVAIGIGIFLIVKHWPRGHAHHAAPAGGGAHGHWYDGVVTFFKAIFTGVSRIVWGLVGLAAGGLALFWLVQWGIGAAHSVYPMPKVNGLRPNAVGAVVTDAPKSVPVAPATTEATCPALHHAQKWTCTVGTGEGTSIDVFLPEEENFHLQGNPLRADGNLLAYITGEGKPEVSSDKWSGNGIVRVRLVAKQGTEEVTYYAQ